MSRLVLVLCLISLPALLAGPSCAARPLFIGTEAMPSDAIVLFDGNNLSEWVYVDSGKLAGWRVENGSMQVHGGNICTKRKFTDFQLHLEYWLPLMAGAKGQGRANSGVYMQGSYEVQVLDSYGLNSQVDDCGAIYGVAAPLVNACAPPEVWQTYDIFFRAPKFDDKGNKTSSARISVLQNGVWIQEAVEVPGPTTAAMTRDIKTPGPIMLQDHGCPVRYRNIWVRPL